MAEFVRKKGFLDPEGFAAYYVEYNDNREWKNKKGEPIIGWKNNINNNWADKFRNKSFQEKDKIYKPQFHYDQ